MYCQSIDQHETVGTYIAITDDATNLRRFFSDPFLRHDLAKCSTKASIYRTPLPIAPNLFHMKYIFNFDQFNSDITK